MVYGIAAVEEPDSSGEIMDYEKSKPEFQAWSDRVKKASNGKSLGNVREMHSLIAAGKLTEINYNDPGKQIEVAAKILNEETWKKIEEGVLTGFSMGGSYGDRWQDGELVRYVARPSELSAVDSPCIPSATYTMVRADGTQELRKFKAAEDHDMEDLELLEKGEKKTKRVGGKDLTASNFAYVGDPEKTATWKLPIHDAAHVRNALARYGQTEGIPENEKAAVRKKIVAAAKKFDIKVSEEAKKLSAVIRLMKSYWNMSELARMLGNLDSLRQMEIWERNAEGDDSTVPEQLAEVQNELDDILKEMVDEEGAEREEKIMTDANKAVVDMLEKAVKGFDLEKAKTVLSHLKKAHAAVKAHHDGMVKLHKAHHDAMVGHLQEACKAAGFSGEEGLEGSSEVITGAGDPKPINIEGEGTKNELTLAQQKADLTKMVGDAIKEAFGEALKAVEATAPEPTNGDRGPSLVKAGVPPRPHVGNIPNDPAANKPPNRTEAAADGAAPVKIDYAKLAAGDNSEMLKVVHAGMIKATEPPPGTILPGSSR